MSIELENREKFELERADSDGFSSEDELETLKGGKAKKGLVKKRKKEEETQELKQEIVLTEHKIPLEELLANLDTSVERGLTDQAVKEKLHEFGYNELTPPKQTPEIIKFLKQLTGFFSLLLWAGSILSGIAYGLDPSEQSNLWLCIVLAVVVLATGTFSYIQERQSSDVMAKFKNFLPQMAKVRRNGEVRSIETRELVPGDIVLIKSGDKLPADIRVISCTEFKVDNSSLTGESEPQQRSPECSSENPLETSNIGFYGTLATSGECVGVVILTGDKTIIGRIARLTSSTGAESTTLHKEINHFIKIISCVAFVIGILFLILSIIIDGNVLQNIVFMIGIIVANVPEGLLATVTVSLTLTAKRMAKKMMLVKNLEAVETLGSTTVICSDKTGTLTQNKMTVSHIWFDGKIYQTETTTSRADFDPEAPTFRHLLNVATFCNNAVFDPNDYGSVPLSQCRTIGDASESALIKFCDPIRPITEARGTLEKVAEVPFNSTNKYQISLHSDRGTSGFVYMKGASERIVARCEKIVINGDVVDLTEDIKNKLKNDMEVLAANGERVLGFCEIAVEDHREFLGPDGKHVLPESGYTFVGLAAMIDPPREGVPEAVAECKSAGIKTIMVTGDHPLTAKSIATKVGILTEGEEVTMEVPRDEDNFTDPNRGIVLQGSMLWNLTDHQWDMILAHDEVVFARTSPQQKLIIVEHNQRLGNIVAVTGDGVNDAPALKKADIGVAMGISGSDVSKEAADMILLDDNFATIVNGVKEGRLIFDNLKKSIAYTLSSNIPEILPFILFCLVRIPLALTTILILCIDLGTDMLPAISLAYEEPEKDIMRVPPRNAKKDHLVSRYLISFSYLQIGVFQALSGVFTYFYVMNDFGIKPGWLIQAATDFNNPELALWHGFSYDERQDILKYAQTAYFASIVTTQVADVLICKTRRLSLFSLGKRAFENKVLLSGILEELLLVAFIAYVPGVNTVLGGAPMHWNHWLISVPFTIFIFFYDEIRKALMRRTDNCGNCMVKSCTW